MAIDPNIRPGASAIAIHTGKPEVIVRHDISDEELDTLCDGGTSSRSQILSIALGGLVGAAPTAIPAGSQLYHGLGIPSSSLVQVLIFVTSLTAMIVTWIATRGQVARSKKLRDDIRKRPKSAY